MNQTAEAIQFSFSVYRISCFFDQKEDGTKELSIFENEDEMEDPIGKITWKTDSALVEWGRRTNVRLLNERLRTKIVEHLTS